ncbi:Protein AF-9 [Dissostichus eleginoides]|uniref:Protein AF-9 n=1 Tax=Dissostichus eleginoides TaxID=100907 RepID=A0AAD9BVV1_DISEL|nr:Protein AF-9 [Dissostichus eleginoides]
MANSESVVLLRNEDLSPAASKSHCVLNDQCNPETCQFNGAVQVKLELGHRAQVRKKPTVEGFTHDWMVFVRGPEQSNIQHFVEKVVFHLHESFPKPKRVIKDPPYKVEESGYAGFILPIEVYFRNKEEPKKVRFDYDLFLHLDGHPPVNHLRCEKLTFNSPTEEFRKKLLKAGGQLDPNKRSSEDSNVMVMQEGSTSLFGQHMKLPSLPSSLTSTFLDQKKSKSFHGSKDHKDKPPKDLKEPKSAFRDSGWESSKVPKEPSRKPKENQPLRDINPKMGFKEPKSLSKEHRTEGMTPGSGLNKRRSSSDADDLMTKKRKKGFVDPSGKQTLGTWGTTMTLIWRTSPTNQILSSFAPTHHKRQVVDFIIRKRVAIPATTHTVLGPLQSVMQDLVSLSDGSESDSSSPSPPSRHEAPPLLKTTNNQILEVKSPTKQSKQDKNKNIDCDKAYLDELVALHKRLMTLREGHILQQFIVDSKRSGDLTQILGNLLLIWKQLIIWLTSPPQRLRVSDLYSPGRSYDGVVGSPGSDCQLLPRSPDNTPGSGKTKSHPAKHSFNTLIKTIAEFTKWLHFLLQDMEVIIWPSVLHTLHRGPCNADGMSSDGGACQEFGFQLKRILNGKRAKLPPKVE